MNQDIAQRIRKIREYRGYAQRYMADKLKIKQNTYSKIESGMIVKIGQARLEQIAHILGVSVDFILNEDMPLLNLDLKSTKDNGNKAIIDKLDKIEAEIKQVKEQNKIILSAMQEKTASKTQLNKKNLVK